MQESSCTAEEAAADGKVKDIITKKEISKPLNTIIEEIQKDIETKENDSLEEYEAFAAEETSSEFSLATSHDKVSFTVKANIPRIMISKDRIAV